VDATLSTSVVSTTAGGATVVVGGLAEGNRLPTAPRFQGVASLGYTTPVMGGGKNMFANLTWQHVGSSFSQFENEVPGFGQVSSDAAAQGAGAARLISLVPGAVADFTFDTELPEYDIANFRVGLRADRWEAALFVNNFTDEHARLALDYERGRSARVAYLTNQPRTVGVSLNVSF
jgi:iron complex outermembrane receptor protein